MGLGNVSRRLDPQTTSFLEKVKEAVEVGQGSRGNRLDRYVTFRDFVSAGLVNPGNGVIVPVNPPVTPPNPAIPPAPTGLVVTGGFSHIHLIWDIPDSLYSNHAVTLVFRNTVDNVGTAVQVHETVGFQFGDLDVDRGVTYYYWIRFVSTSDIEGPFNSSVGSLGQISEDPAQVLELLSDQITETQLFADLNTRINLIDTPVTGLVARMGAVETTAGSNVSAITGLDARVTVNENGLTSQANSITVLQADVVSAQGTADSKNQTFISNNSNPPSAVTVGDLWVVQDLGNLLRRWNGVAWQDTQDTAIVNNATAISSLDARVTSNDGDITAISSDTTQLRTDVNGNSATLQTQGTSINGLEVQYTVKADLNGYVAGYGFATTSNSYDGGIHSSMQFSVDTFSVAAPGATDMAFVVDSGRVVMSGALIQDATINTAQIGSIAVDRITGITSSFLLANIGVGNVTNAYIGNIIQSNNYVPGVSGWNINKSGTSEFRNITARGNIEATTIRADAANIISTLMLQGQAVTIPTSAFSTSTTSTPANFYTQTLSITFVSTGAPVMIWGVYNNRNNTGSGDALSVQVRRNGITIWNPGNVQNNANGVTTPYPFAFQDTPGAGSVTYTVWARPTDNANFAISRSLVALEVKV